MPKIFALIALLASAHSLQAAWYDDVRLGDPEYGGTGCPAGSAAVAVAADAKSMSILFDEFVTEAGGNTGRRLDRKTCNIAVPVHVPQGYSVSIFQIDYRGFNSLPFGAYSVFNVEYFFAGTQGPSYQKRFDGRLENNYLLSNQVAASAYSWSECGQSVILRANTSMMVRTNGQNQDALSTVDSADLQAGLIFNLQWRRCEN
jgi:hypothetical protein